MAVFLSAGHFSHAKRGSHQNQDPDSLWIGSLIFMHEFHVFVNLSYTKLHHSVATTSGQPSHVGAIIDKFDPKELTTVYAHYGHSNTEPGC